MIYSHFYCLTAGRAIIEITKELMLLSVGYGHLTGCAVGDYAAAIIFKVSYSYQRRTPISLALQIEGKGILLRLSVIWRILYLYAWPPHRPFSQAILWPPFLQSIPHEGVLQPYPTISSLPG